MIHTFGLLAQQYCNIELPLQVLKSNAGFYIGTADDAGPCSREVLEADDRLQVLLGDYLRESWALNERAAGIDTRNYVPLYDAWRREILGVLLQRPADTLPALTSLAS